jgi:hypothetical protein
VTPLRKGEGPVPGSDEVPEIGPWPRGQVRYFRVASHTQIVIGERVFTGGEVFGVKNDLGSIDQLVGESGVWVRNGWAERIRKPSGKAQVVQDQRGGAR